MMLSSFSVLANVCLIWFTLLSLCSASTYEEHLVLKPLPQQSLLGSFNFRSSISESSFRAQNFQTFPRSLGQILLHSHTDELHLRFSTGRWDAETWGPRPWDGTKEGGTGVELWAWVEGHTEQIADARWLTLTNALSGLFCASLNFIDATRTIRPVSVFEREGYHNSSTSGSSLHLLHGMLPNEVVCTENLTPFLKLLPCKGKAGISSLLDGHKLFDASWQTMSIDVTRKCDSAGANCDIEVEQTVDMVLSLERAQRSRDDPIARPKPIANITCDPDKHYNLYGDSCMPVPGPSLPAFKVSEIFGRPIRGSCPTIGLQDATDSVCVDVQPEQSVSIDTAATYEDRVAELGRRCFSPSLNADFDVAFSSAASTSHSIADTSLLVSRTLSGRGQQAGGILTTLHNPSPFPLQLIYLETLPWFMKPYYHTLTTHLHFHSNNSRALIPTGEAVKSVYYRPAVDRVRASHLELVLEVPAEATLTLAYDFEKAILRYTEYPPDANRGFDVAPAVIKVLPYEEHGKGDGAQAGKATYLRTTSLLLYLPTPDFSMPYNVIILTSTVIALAFGSIFNVLVRRFVAADEVPTGATLKDKVRAQVARLKGKIAQLTGKRKAE